MGYGGLAADEGGRFDDLYRLLQGGIEIIVRVYQELQQDLRFFIDQLAIDGGIRSGRGVVVDRDRRIQERHGLVQKVFEVIVGPVVKNIGLGSGKFSGHFFVSAFEMLEETVVTDQSLSDAVVIPAGPFQEAAWEDTGPAVEPVTHAEVGFGCRGWVGVGFWFGFEIWFEFG